MTRLSQLFLGALVAALLLAFPAHCREEDEDDEPAAAGNPCLTLAQTGAEKALTDLSKLPGARGKLARVELRGLKGLDEERLWETIGGKPALPISLEASAALAARLDQTGLFAAVGPRIHGDALIIDVEPQPKVVRVELSGLREIHPDDILERLLRAPPDPKLRSFWDDEPRERRRFKRKWWKRSRRRAVVREPAAEVQRCFAPDPPREWLASVERGVVHPGHLWQGLQRALDRVAAQLHRESYPLSSFRGTLDEDGTLHIDFDEGRVEGFDVGGVHPAIRDEVRELLGVRPGDAFSIGGLRAGVQRVRQRYPFLHLDGSLRASVRADRVSIEQGPSRLRFRTLPPDRERTVETIFAEDEDWSRWSTARRRSRRARSLEIDGQRLRLHFRSDRTAVTSDMVELLRHTQVTGFAPGLQLSLRFWDPGDRAHLSLDGLFQINSKRSGRAVEGDLWHRIGRSERVDWLFGPKLQIPALRLAELGAQMHTLTDTEDRFRIGRFDSYLWSFLSNRPESEYFRRTGIDAFATFHVADRLTLGVEGRLDRYASLESVRVPTVFNRDERAYKNPAIDEGLMSSAVFRLEWSSDPISAHKLGNVWRSTGASLLPRDFSEPQLRTLLTVEVGSRALGGELKFVKVISDSTLILETSRRSTLRFRTRIAGGSDLPLQKQEGLGGWEALRGYGFKEYRGDWSLLGTLEYANRHGFGLFADVGAVHQPQKWTDPSLGVGGLFQIEDVRFEAAWRTDQHARLAPEMRVLFVRTF